MLTEFQFPGPLILAFLSTLAIMYVLPWPVYPLMEGMGIVELPTDGTPRPFTSRCRAGSR